VSQMNRKATAYSAVCSIGATFLLTWVTEANSLHAWTDLGGFAFWTKVVTTGATIGGLSTYLAHKSFRDPNQRTRRSDSMLGFPPIRRNEIGDVSRRE
jgi:hypothetical protein